MGPRIFLRFITIFLSVTISFPLISQEALAPEAPELVLPPFLLEVDEEGPVMVEAPLPSEEALGLPPLELPLPRPEDLRLSPLSPELKLPVPDPVAEVPQESGSDFFSRGSLGGGNGNYILGDISLFKLGEGPRFTLHFRHQSRDGFGGARAGEGFTLREDLLEGTLQLDNPTYDAAMGLGYREEEIGLQGVGIGDSLNLRRYAGEGEASFAAGTRGTVNLSGKGSYMERWLSGGTENRQDALSLAPKGEYILEWESLNLGISGSYRYDSVAGTGGDPQNGHTVGGLLRLEGFLPQGWAAALEGGAVWHPGEELAYPFSLSAAGSVGSLLSLSFSGGYVHRPYNFGDLQENIPFLSLRDSAGAPAAPASLNGWEGGTTFRWTPTEVLFFEGEAGFALWENLLQPATALPAGESPFVQEEKNLLSFRLAAGWLFDSLLHLSASWEGQGFLDRDLLRPENRLSLRLEVGGEADPREELIPSWGGHLEGAWEIFPSGSPYADQYPYLEISGYYRVSPGVRIIVQAKDLLAPLIDEGRLAWEDFQAPGLSAALLVGISL